MQNLPQITTEDERGVATTRVSVIVPTKNVERFLEGCLRSVRENNYPQDLVELIVIDNGSTDCTLEVGRQFTDKVFCFPGITIAALRNRGAAQAQGEVFAFLDADCLAGPDWLWFGVETVTTENCVAGCLYDLPENPAWLEADWFCQRDPGQSETTHTGAGNLFIRRELFESLCGFNEKLVTGEDTELCSRARKVTKIISDDRIQAIHLGNPKTIPQFLKREIWYGLGAFGSFKVSRFDKPLLGTLAFIALSATQLVGFVGALTGTFGWSLFWLACTALSTLLSLTVYYRRRYVKDFFHALRLAFLYYLYYLGRALSLFYLVTGKEYYHRIKDAQIG